MWRPIKSAVHIKRLRETTFQNGKNEEIFSRSVCIIKCTFSESICKDKRTIWINKRMIYKRSLSYFTRHVDSFHGCNNKSSVVLRMDGVCFASKGKSEFWILKTRFFRLRVNHGLIDGLYGDWVIHSWNCGLSFLCNVCGFDLCLLFLWFIIVLFSLCFTFIWFVYIQSRY